MQIGRGIPLVVVLLSAIVLTACAPSAAATHAPPADQYYEAAPAATQAPAATAAPAAMAAPTQAAAPGSEAMQQSIGYEPQMVIKNGDMRLLVKNTDTALDGVTQVVSDVRGYVVSSRTWYQDYYGTNYKYATLTIGVPVDQFENALRRLHSLAVRVLDDTASGEDVTNQYVDLQSQMTNLEVTRDRIRKFLDQAKTVDEALRINQQLSDVEGQIEKVKGQMNYLSNRSAFSTITINLEPDLPKIELTPTPTATPTPTVALAPWDPGQTTQQATDTLVSAYRVVIDMLIWFFVVLVPIFGPPALIIWLVYWFVRRRMKATAPKA